MSRKWMWLGLLMMLPTLAIAETGIPAFTSTPAAGGGQTYSLSLQTLILLTSLTFLPAVLLNYVPDEKKNTYLGLLTFVGLIIAMIVQPISGALSDRWESRLGRIQDEQL